jgi:hypothetical protein
VTDAEDARDYLADDIDAESEEWGEDYESAFEDLAEFLRDMDADDPLLARLAVVVAPFLENDDRLDGTLYPLGEGVTYEDETDPGEITPHAYLEGLVAALERDHARWTAHVADVGDDAAWTMEFQPPEV